MLRTRVRQLAERATVYAKVAHHTGLIQQLRPNGAVAAVKTLLSGNSGPSAIFRIHGANAPDRPALLYGNRARSFGEVDQRIDRLATGLRRRGIQRGDGAILMMHNRPDCFEIASALSRLGAAGIAISWRSTSDELKYLANHSGAKALFFDPELWPTIKNALGDIPGISRTMLFPTEGTIEDLTELENVLSPVPDGDLGAMEGTVIIYTSGTTGKPKGAVRSFSRGTIIGLLSFVSVTPMRHDDRHLCICPLYHSTAMGFAGMTLMLGGSVVIMREFDPEKFLATVERERITTTAIVPTLLHRLMSLSDDVFQKYDTRSLRAIFCGGAQLPGPLALRTMDRLGPVLYNFYGATETGLVTLATPSDLQQSPGTIGRAIPGNEILLLDEQGQVVPDGQVGELFARNSMIVDGYHADEEATKQSQKHGFFSVGDLAVKDSNGNYHIAGRRRDMVISGGTNIYPAEVEAAIEKFEPISQVAVVGIPDDEWGERLRAFVVLKPNQHTTASDIVGFLRGTLSGPKIPREWVFLEHLPSNPTGKILKRELRSYDGPIEKA